ncbi:hypothetical protein SCP_0309900 [Sparassis crispa]|uniref:Uncharacterized protein n=1 Tax=Sparassis crispa TaxID=139825 RepID=A0A401GGN3_9APHY|nr:hypothetical protein SCP_0309900 [Sparassis crispa]GBE81263.1 hypothetical protein SCP_0309900 [Sparassis crispa]
MVAAFVLTRTFVLSALFVGAFPLTWAAPLGTYQSARNAVGVRDLDTRSGCWMAGGFDACLRGDSEEPSAPEVDALTVEPVNLSKRTEDADEEAKTEPQTVSVRELAELEERSGCWMPGEYDACIREDAEEPESQSATPEVTAVPAEVEPRSGCWMPGDDTACTAEERDDTAVSEREAREALAPPADPDLEARSDCVITGECL